MGKIMFDEGHQSKYINRFQAVLHCWMLSDDDMAILTTQINVTNAIGQQMVLIGPNRPAAWQR